MTWEICYVHLSLKVLIIANNELTEHYFVIFVYMITVFAYKEELSNMEYLISEICTDTPC